MTRLIAPIILALALAGPAAAETRALTGFSSVAANGKYRVEVSQGDTYSVVVEGPDAERINTIVQGGRLRATQRGSWFGAGRRLNATLHVRLPQVEALSVANGAQMSANGLASRNLNLNAAQGGQLELHDLRATAVSLAAAQGGMLEVAGVCETLTASAAMGGMIEADDLHCASARASASMGGMVEIHASNSIDASASMGGSIDVSGHPEVRSSSSTMGGEIDIK